MCPESEPCYTKLCVAKLDHAPDALPSRRPCRFAGASRSSDVVRVTLYRALLRLARVHDRDPALKAMLTASRPSTRYSHEQQRWVPGPTQSQRPIDTVATEFLGGPLYHPGRSYPAAGGLGHPGRSGSLRDFVKRKFRYPGVPLFHPAALDTACALALLSQNEASLPREAERAVADADGGDPTWQPQEQGLRRGCVLLTNASDASPSFARAQLLLLRHAADGESLALLLNKPTPLSLVHAARCSPPLDGCRSARWHTTASSSASSRRRRWSCTACARGRDGSHADGAALFVSELGGGFLAAAEALLAARGAATPADFKVVLGRAVWGRAQLEGEWQQNLWYQGAATRAADLEAAVLWQGGAAEPEEEQQMLLDAIDEGEARLGDGGENGEEQRLHALHEELDEHLICERGQDAWARMLREFGGEYRAIASLAPAAFHDDDDSDGDEEPDLPIII